MRIPIYQVDAFASRLFEGNPAAVCPLDRWLPDETLQAIAAENNLAETAFYVRSEDRIELRWFTPEVEMDLCGHATLATAHVMREIRREIAGPRVEFATRSGMLAVERDGDLYALDFPAYPPLPCEPSAAIAEALGAQPETVLAAKYYFCVFAAEQDV